jgi:hypothetical protein
MKRLLPLALAIAAASVTQPIHATTIDQASANELILTELSSTTLLATYNGSTSRVTINFLGFDGWLVTVNSAFFTTSVAWQEPENPNTGFSNIFFANGAYFIVVSDQFIAGVGLPNGTTADNVGFDTVNGLPINVTFFDNGDVPIPDTGSTVGLLFLSSVALLEATRLRSFRLV